MFADAGLICDIHELRFPCNREPVLQQSVLAIGESQEQRLRPTVVVINEKRAGGEPVYLRMKIDFPQRGNLDPREPVIAQIAIQNIAVLWSLQRIGEKNILQPVIVEITDSDRVTHRHQPFGKMANARINIVHHPAHLRIDSRNRGRNFDKLEARIINRQSRMNDLCVSSEPGHSHGPAHRDSHR